MASGDLLGSIDSVHQLLYYFDDSIIGHIKGAASELLLAEA